MAPIWGLIFLYCLPCDTMKRLFFAVVLSLASAIAWGANPALGIHNISGLISAASYTSPTGDTSQTSGSSFIVLVGTNNVDTAAPSVSDTFGNTYTVLTLGSGSNPVHESNDGGYYYAIACLGCAGGANHTITVTSSGEQILEIIEFAEIENSSTLDVSASAYITSTTLNISVTPTVSGDLILAGAFTAGASGTLAPSGTGFTALENSNPGSDFSMGSGYLTDASTSAYDASMSIDADTGLAGVTLAFKPSSSSSCTHAGWTSGGAFTVPTAGTTVVLNENGSFATVNCTSDPYWQSSGAFGDN